MRTVQDACTYLAVIIHEVQMYRSLVGEAVQRKSRVLLSVTSHASTHISRIDMDTRYIYIQLQSNTRAREQSE